MAILSQYGPVQKKGGIEYIMQVDEAVISVIDNLSIE